MKNSVTLIGNLGGDVELKEFDSGSKAARFSLATSETYKNKQGEKVTETQWHTIKLWGKLAELAHTYLKKGSSVCIDGKIVYNQYEKDGEKRYYTEIVAEKLTFLGGNKSSQEQPPVAQTANEQPASQKVDSNTGLPF